MDGVLEEISSRERGHDCGSYIPEPRPTVKHGGKLLAAGTRVTNRRGKVELEKSTDENEGKSISRGCRARGCAPVLAREG